MNAKKHIIFLSFSFFFLALSAESTTLDKLDIRSVILAKNGLINCEKLGNENQIFLCNDEELGKQVVVKSFNNSMMNEYFKEKPILEYLQITGIVKLYKSIEDRESNRYFLVLEYSPYGDLKGLIKNKNSISEDVARLLFIQFINAFSKMHDNQIAHRDIKLENLLLVHDNKVKVIDFGGSDDLRNGKTANQETLGTEYTSAPEVYHKELRENGQLDPYKSDVFSTGAVLAIMVVGTSLLEELVKNPPPSYRDNFNIRTILNKLKSSSKGIPSLSEDFINLISLMMSPKPSERPSMKQVLDHPWVKMQRCPFCGGK